MAPASPPVSSTAARGTCSKRSRAAQEAGRGQQGAAADGLAVCAPAPPLQPPRPRSARGSVAASRLARIIASPGAYASAAVIAAGIDQVGRDRAAAVQHADRAADLGETGQHREPAIDPEPLRFA
jgi:hypothetical protein